MSVLYAIAVAYIEDEFNAKVLGRELIMTPIRMTIVAFIVRAIIMANNQLVRFFRYPWLRYFIEIPAIVFLVYWFIYGFSLFIEYPILGTNYPDTGTWLYRRHVGLYILATFFIYVFLSGLNIYVIARKTEAKAELLRREFSQMQMQALKSQVNPHFLFNSLSVLSSLVHVNADLSEKFIMQLAKAYRYILEQKEHDLVSLSDEMSFLDSYFFLLQIRFDKKIQLEKRLDIDPEKYLLPPLTLQLLVENAVKHNRMSAREPLQIKIFLEGTGLVVENNISQRELSEPSTGIGLENIMRRYALLSDKQPLIQNTEKTFRVLIPLIRST